MSGFDKQRARAICEAATPGPWRIDGRHEADDAMHTGVDYIESAGGDRIVCGDSGVYPPCLPDATFIAESRTLLPAALDRIERLEALLRETLDALDYIDAAFVPKFLADGGPTQAQRRRAEIRKELVNA